jgi:mRNA interferase RelE/StbE
MKRIAFSPAAQADLLRHASIARRVIKTLQRLASGGSVDAIKLSDGSDRWRLRVGTYRVIYAEIEDTLLVLKVGPRGSVYGD